MWAMDVILEFLVAMLKSEKKQVKLILITYLPQYTQNIIVSRCDYYNNC